MGVAIEIGDEQLVPDLSFIGPDRVDELDADGFHVPPDLVAEVTSLGTRSLDLFKKRNLYAKIGVPEYWVVDLGEGRAVAHRREGAGVYDIVEHTGGVLRTEQAPGLEIPLAELFGDG